MDASPAKCTITIDRPMARTKDPELERQRRQQVADATIDLLTELPWGSVSLTRVAERAGVSRGVVTYWYDSKEALLRAAVERFHERYSERLLALAATPVPVRERLVLLLEAVLPDRDTLRREAAFQAEVYSFAKAHPDVLEPMADSYLRFHGIAEALVQIGRVEGFVTATDTQHTARFIHALIDGVSLHVAHDESLRLPQVRERLLVLIDRWLREST